MNCCKWGALRSDEPKTQACICPHCNLAIAGKIHLKVDEYSSCAFYILECPSCGYPIIYRRYGEQVYPNEKALRPVQYLNEKIDAVYEEIRNAIGAGCYTAAVGLARTAINHIAVDKGAEGNKSFQYYVQYLVDEGFVPPNAGKWIDKIRQMANDSVHHLEIWKQEEAMTIGNFLMYLLIFIYL